MIHHVYANQENIGDWLSARGIQSLLPGPVQEHFCDAPFVEDTLAALGELGPDDFIVIGGGGLFMNYFVPFWEGFLPIAARVPFCIWGAGYCDMKRERSRPPMKLISEIVGHSRLCIVRDELTRQNLSDCELPPPVICPSVVAVPTQGGHPQGVLNVDHYDNVGPEIYERIDRTADDFAMGTGRTYRQTNNLVQPGSEAALQRALDLYTSADLIVTSRLHGCIIGLATGRRVLVVSADRKVESFMRAAGLSEWVCDLDDIDSLPARLKILPQQPIPFEFIERGREQNRKVGLQVGALAALQPSR